MNTRFEVFASNNILQYMCDFIHVLIFVNVSKCWKRPKLKNIVIQMVQVFGFGVDGIIDYFLYLYLSKNFTSIQSHQNTTLDQCPQTNFEGLQ